MSSSSTAILARFLQNRPPQAGPNLRAAYPGYFRLLHKLGDPQAKLPRVFHVAGTNGKGSTCAFLRAMLEAAGYRVHVYTSPHLVHYHERIRINGTLIGEDEFVEILTECEKHAEPGEVSTFEATTAAAFLAFARHPADFTILETGLGGRLDATNVVDMPLAAIITRLSYDHRQYLGTSLTEIAQEKAGIMRAYIPCFTAPQPDTESLNALRASAALLHAPLSIGGSDWRIEPVGSNGFRFIDHRHALDLPSPALTGAHQFWNAGLAIAALLGTDCPIAPPEITKGLLDVEWPARLQKLANGTLAKILPPGWELWLDGGHNNSAGEVLATQATAWQSENYTAARPLHLVMGMLKTKNPAEFLAPLLPHISSLHAISIPDEPQSFLPSELASLAETMHFKNAVPANGVRHALDQIGTSFAQPGRVLICGSLYLAGDVLKLDQAESVTGGTYACLINP